jgi:two-component system nitrogen regulation response regulator NtrX
MDGLGILNALHREEPRVPCVMISGHGTIETAVQAIQQGAYDFIEKPFKSDRLLLVVSRALEAARLQRENSELRLRAGAETEIVGISPPIAQLRSAIERVAPTGSRVLISGPAGRGEGGGGADAARPFAPVGRALRRAELRDAGAGTIRGGAVRRRGRRDPLAQPRRAGVLERAHGGTLLLDEVADMPLETQGKIVRALQEQGFTRMGGAARVQVDVRVIATTNRDLQAEIGAGRFREDLYYRLAVVPLKVPPLRERREDIPALARHFMARSGETSGMAPREISEDALAAMQAYEWPGNVRELRNLIDWLLIMAPGDAKEPIRPTCCRPRSAPRRRRC